MSSENIFNIKSSSFSCFYFFDTVEPNLRIIEYRNLSSNIICFSDDLFFVNNIELPLVNVFTCSHSNISAIPPVHNAVFLWLYYISSDKQDNKEIIKIAQLACKSRLVLLLIRLSIPLLVLLPSILSQKSKPKTPKQPTINETKKNTSQDISFHRLLLLLPSLLPLLLLLTCHAKKEKQTNKKSKNRKNWFKHENITKQCRPRTIKMLNTNWYLYEFG